MTTWTVSIHQRLNINSKSTAAYRLDLSEGDDAVTGSINSDHPVVNDTLHYYGVFKTRTEALQAIHEYIPATAAVVAITNPLRGTTYHLVGGHVKTGWDEKAMVDRAIVSRRNPSGLWIAGA